MFENDIYLFGVINNKEAFYGSVGLMNAIRRAWNMNRTKVHMNIQPMTKSGHVAKRRRAADITIWHFNNDIPVVNLYGDGQLATRLFDALTLLKDKGQITFSWFDDDTEPFWKCAEY